MRGAEAEPPANWRLGFSGVAGAAAASLGTTGAFG
jgi:hypothetical protein